MKKIYALLMIFCGITTMLQAQIRLPIPFKHRTHYLLDFVAGTASVAFSVARKLHKDYSGPLFRVSRDTDQSQIDIPILRNEVDYEFLKNFIGTSRARVVKLYDQSGNGNDANIDNIQNGGFIAVSGGELHLTANSNKLSLRIGREDNNVFFNLTRSVVNPNMSAIYVGKSNQRTTPRLSSLGVGGSGFSWTDYSRFSLNLTTSSFNNKLGVTIFYIGDYASTLSTPTQLSSVMWTKENGSRFVNIYLNDLTDIVDLRSVPRAFELRRIIDNSYYGTQDFQEFIYFDKILTDKERIDVFYNNKKFYQTP